MSLSQKIAAALDETTRAYACRATSRSRTARTGSPWTSPPSTPSAWPSTSLDFVTTDRPRLVVRGPQAWGDRLAARVTYLMEPLKVLELDAGGGEVADPQPVADRARRTARLLRGPALQAGLAPHGTRRLR